mgnify:CR=1 FL=1
MDYFEYRDLAPIDNVENGDKYMEALNWAFQNKKIKNIALTGPYGAGKSSVIETFLSQDDKKNCKQFRFRRDTIRKTSLKISMATFFKGKSSEKSESTEKIEVDADEVEQGILKQLFYKVEPRKIPQSRYRKIYNVKFFSVLAHIFVALLLITFLSAIFATEKCSSFVEAINTFLLLHLKEKPSNIRTYSFIGILFLGISSVIAYLYCTVISRFRIKEVKLPSETTIQSGREEADSVFNKNLDEIMYFFESTGYRIVFFEDLDRLDDPKIFVHLRELNNLLNNDDVVKRKPIVFVYAVRDDIFSKEDRTKFFDFIIPIIPVVNSTNSGEILLQRLQEAKEKGIEHNISQGFVLDVAPYISDMRVLQNIYNEFIIYKDTLRTTQELSLSDEQMLAMIVFKNIYPSDFADIQNESGVIKEAFENKRRFISARKQEIQDEIDSYSTTVEQYQADSMKSVREIKYAMFGELMGRLGTPISLNVSYLENISAKTIMNDNFDLTQLLVKDYNEISYYYGSGSPAEKTIKKETIESYIERWREINRVRKIGLQEIQDKLQKLRMQQHNLSGISIAELLENYPLEEALSEKVQRNKLLVFLFRRAYIDEKYASYINYFKGTSITKDDMNFILSVKNREPLAFDYQLTKTSMVIQRLQEYEFEEKAIYNFDLLEELLLEGESIKLNAFIEQLSNEKEISWRFIDEFFSCTKQREQFIQLLTENWTGMWSYICADETMSYDHKVEYLCEIITASPIKTLNVDNSMTAFFEQHEDILQKLERCENERVISAIQCLNVHFTRLLIENVSNNILDAVFDGNFFALNQEMIETIVRYKNSSMVNELTTFPYSTLINLKYLPLLQYVQDNIELYVREIVLTNVVLKDNAEDIIDLLKRLDGVTELQQQIIRQEQFTLSNIEDCAGDLVRKDRKKWNAIWDELLTENNIEPNWNNIIQYWNIYSLTDTLKKYVSAQVDALKEVDTAVVSDAFIKEFINSKFGEEVQRKLIPVLKMDDFDMDVSEIDPLILQIMIDCRYFAFSAEHYIDLAAISPALGVAFITQNQAEFMSIRDSIAMSDSLFESLMNSERIQKEYKDELFTEYAENYMTEGVAMKIVTSKFPVTKDIVEVALKCVDQRNQAKILFANCGVYDAENLQQKFDELGGKYADLGDRTRRHDVILSATPEHYVLAEYLEKIGYITSKEEKIETKYDAALEREETEKFLKLRVKKVQEEEKMNG